MRTNESVEELYHSFIKNGGTRSLISKNSEDSVGRKIYSLVKNLEMRHEDGRRFTLAEKFLAKGISFVEMKLSKERKFVSIKAMLDDFVASGRKVEDLKKTDKEYKEVKNFKMVDENGRRLTVEEKFAAFGHPRKAKLSKDVKADLISAISSFLQNGGDIYMQRSNLPFFRAEYGSFARKQRLVGVVGDLAFQTNLRSLGFDYSEMFYQYGKVLEFYKFKDSLGFVDSYRKNIKMDSFVKASSYKLGLPIPVFVGLVGNADLEGCYLDTDYFGFVTTELGKYLEVHKDFVGMSKIDKPLYEKLKHIARMSFSPDLSEISTEDVAYLLGYGDIKNDFGKESNHSEFTDLLTNIRIIASQKGGKLSRSDIAENDYRKIIGFIASTGATTTSFFKLYDIDYDGKDGKRLAKIWVNGYPYMSEMRAERDRILAEHGLSMSGDCKKEDLFDVLIDASTQAFEKYKSQIFNFEVEKITQANQKDESTQKQFPADKNSGFSKTDGGKV